MKIDMNGNWKLYWGNIPLPQEAEPIGVIDGGALILLRSGKYVRGNAGGISCLDQLEVKAELGLLTHGSGKHSRVDISKTRRKQRKLQATDHEWELILRYADKLCEK
jgi:hypothetical protein